MFTGTETLVGSTESFEAEVSLVGGDAGSCSRISDKGSTVPTLGRIVRGTIGRGTITTSLEHGSNRVFINIIHFDSVTLGTEQSTFTD